MEELLDELGIEDHSFVQTLNPDGLNDLNDLLTTDVQSADYSTLEALTWPSSSVQLPLLRSESAAASAAAVSGAVPNFARSSAPASVGAALESAGSLSLGSHHSIGSGAAPAGRLARLRSNSFREDARRARDKSKDNLKHLEQQVQRMSNELQHLSLENEKLKFWHSVLDKVVRLRTDQLEAIKKVQETAESALSSTAHPRPEPDLSAFTTSSMLQCALAIYAQSKTPADRLRCKSMGVKQFIKEWKDYLAEASRCLLALELDASNAALSRELVKATCEICCLLRSANLVAPDVYQKAQTVHLETEAQAVPEHEHWVSVLHSMAFKPEQQQELLAVYEVYRRIMVRVHAERQAINAVLEAGLQAPSGVAQPHSSLGGSGGGGRGLMALGSPECNILQTLDKNLRREKSAHQLLRGYVLGHICSIWQFAKMAVYSYPHFPDVTAVVTALAQQQGAGGQQQVQG